MTAAMDTADASWTSLAPSRSPVRRASMLAAGSSPRTFSTRASRPVQPSTDAPAESASGSCKNALSSSATRSTGLRHAFASSIRSAPPSCVGNDASTTSARSQPATSSASSALLTKSTVCPPSRYRWSVAAAKSMSASFCDEAPARDAVTSARSAPSESRTSMKPRNHRASCSGSAGPGSGSSRKCGGCPAESAATSASP
jgi:hypothetical protein